MFVDEGSLSRTGLPSDSEIRRQLALLLAAPPFKASQQVARFLQFTVEKTLEGEADAIKEGVLGREVCGRKSGYDPRLDPIVRVTAVRLRTKLAEYYECAGPEDPVVIDYPKGQYVPVFRYPSGPVTMDAAPAIETSESTPGMPREQTYRGRWITAAAGIAFGVGATALWNWAPWKPESAPSVPVRFEVVPPPGQTFQNVVMGGALAMSPDGRTIALKLKDAPGADSSDGVWLYSLADMSSRKLPGTGSCWSPFWSPDGKYIACFDKARIIRLAVDGKSPRQVIYEGSAPYFSGSWNASGGILFASNAGGLQIVNASGGAATNLTEPDSSKGEGVHAWPQFLPDGRHFIYTSNNLDPQTSAIYVASLDRPKEVKRLITARSRGIFIPGRQGQSKGLLAYRQGSALVAVPFDAAKLEVSGEAQTLERVVNDDPISFDLDLSGGPDGTYCFRAGPAVARRELLWISRNGQKPQRRWNPGLYRYPQVSPDGQHIAMERIDPDTGRSEIWMVDSDRDVARRVTDDPGGQAAPVWSPDGKVLAFRSARSVAMRVAQGAGVQEVVYHSNDNKYPTSWSRDGRYLVLNWIDPSRSYDLMLVAADRSGGLKPFRQTKSMELDGQISPDNGWIAYRSDESGRFQIMVEEFLPDSPARRRMQISSATGTASTPRWKADGTELYYVEDGELMAAPIRMGSGTLSPGRPVALFSVKQFFNGAYGYSPAPGGDRFLFSAAIGPEYPSPGPVTVVLRR